MVSRRKVESMSEGEKLKELNDSTHEGFLTQMMRVCASMRWGEQMAMSRPFASSDELYLKADKIWNALDPQDWFEAFSHHPKIGERKKPLEKWAEQEQAGAQNASSEIQNTLEEWNQRYEEKFGYVFLVCATGKSAEEMLGLLKKRFEK